MMDGHIAQVITSVGRACLRIFAPLFTGALVSASMLIYCGIAFSQVMVERISVVNDMGKGVPSEVVRVDENSVEKHFAYTGPDGVAEPNKVCPVSNRLSARPAVDIYIMSRVKPECAREVNITVQLSWVGAELFSMGEKYFAESEYGTAIMLFTEASQRAEVAGLPVAAVARRRAYEALGKELGIEDPVQFDNTQGIFVPTVAAVEMLKTFQELQGLPVTGQLDWDTQYNLSGKPIGPFIVEAYGEEWWSFLYTGPQP